MMLWTAPAPWLAGGWRCLRLPQAAQGAIAAVMMKLRSCLPADHPESLAVARVSLLLRPCLVHRSCSQLTTDRSRCVSCRTCRIRPPWSLPGTNAGRTSKKPGSQRSFSPPNHWCPF
jgi:hypothetical protein